MKPQIGIIGYAGPEEYPQGTLINPKVYQYAYKLGQLCARNDWTVVTGGKSGIMFEASKGAKSAGGLTVGVVTGNTRKTCNSFVDVEVVSNMHVSGEESILVSMCDALISLGGGAGTLQELAIAYRMNKPIVAIKDLGGWSEKIQTLSSLDERNKMLITTVNSSSQAITFINQLLKQE